jgi:ELWxxDGT repeat protein
MRGYDAAGGFEPWITDGSTAGTFRLADLRPGGGIAGDSLAPTVVTRRPAPDFTALGDGRFLFAADDGVHGQEPWITDLTADGTRMLADLHPGATGSMPDELTRLADGRVVFFADDGVHGAEPWVTDGTAQGTGLLRDLRDGFFGSAPDRLRIVADGLASFVTADGDDSSRLHVTDGTPQGTRTLSDRLREESAGA